ncbi:MAG: flagellar basal body P-ring protein FlgI [Planctomycetaceae bacterium]
MQFSKTVSVLLLVASCGCRDLDLRFQSPDIEAEDFETRVETPLVGEFTTTAGLNLITLQGVGLVTGLNGTGGDPPVSVYRTTLLNEMRRRSIKNPNQILASPTTAMVVVRAYLPPLIRKGERFDIEVRLPPNSEAESLEGGWLMQSYLAEHALVPGQGIMKGHVFAKAEGPILVSLAKDDEGTASGLVKRGRILAGGSSLQDRDLSVFLKSSYRSIRNSKRISDRIAARFYHHNESGIRESLSEAKTDQKIVLKLHPTYRENFRRYLALVRNIAFRETAVAQRVRMEQLQDRIRDPRQAEKSALQLEAIGHESIPLLKNVLQETGLPLESRFHAAVSLAYLGEPSCVPVLEQAAREEPAFRIFALAALSVVDESDAHVALRNLMDEPGAETRYGAFRALTTLDKHDPFVRGKNLNDAFMYHVLDTAGEPLVHLTNHRKSELVLFGADQEFRTPVVLRAGRHILITSGSDRETIRVSRFEVGKPDQQQQVSPQINDVVRAVAELGGDYPDIVDMLLQANRQSLLPGTLEIDSIPQAGRIYYRPQGASQSDPGQSARIGHARTMPNLFDSVDSAVQPAQTSSATSVETEPLGTATAIDTRQSVEAQTPDADPLSQAKRTSFVDRITGLWTRKPNPDDAGTR